MLNALTLSESGESALSQLGLLAADPRPGRDPSWAAVAAVAVVEAHVNRILRELFSSSSISSHMLGRELIDAVFDETLRTWRSRLRWLKRGFGVDIAGEKPWQEFLSAVEIRNALMHGNSFFTDIQTANLARFLQLRHDVYKHFGVIVEGRRLTFSGGSLERIILVCRRFVQFLDERVLTLHELKGRCERHA